MTPTKLLLIIILGIIFWFIVATIAAVSDKKKEIPSQEITKYNPDSDTVFSNRYNQKIDSLEKINRLVGKEMYEYVICQWCIKHNVEVDFKEIDRYYNHADSCLK